MNARLKAEHILALARTEGFTLAGIAPASPAPGAGQFAEWLAAGYAAGMSYLRQQRAAREDLRRRFPWAESVLVVGAYYGEAGPPAVAGSPLAGLARYARGRDYHQTFQTRLKKLAAALLGSKTGVTRARYYVDAGPVSERGYAAAAGIGWIGKNSLLLTPERGSYLVLGAIVLDAEAPSATPLEDHCGGCRACFEACPTGALRQGRQVDARRCLAYWTIETVEALPASVEAHGGSWWFGCDVCQEVCPFNRRAPDPDFAEWRAPPRIAALGWDELAHLNRECFDAVFQASAVRRAGRQVVCRNARAAAIRTGVKLSFPNPIE